MTSERTSNPGAAAVRPVDGIEPIRFFHRGRVVEIDDAHPTRSVLDWLREDARCTGTKEGCNEGDCGACTVVIGELAGELAADEGGAGGDEGGLRLRTVNACIQFLPTLDGKALFTVEDLQAQATREVEPARHDKHAVRRLHPVQQAMVECHGSQCGFCTPGFVMSLWSTYEGPAAATGAPSRQQLADALSGNLCRCTGYRPILDAGQRMFELPPVRLDRAPVVAALQELRARSIGDGFRYRSQRAAHPGREGGTTFHAPRTLEALAALRERAPQARLLAGATDIGLWVNKQMRELGDLIYVGGVAQLRQIEVREESLRIGAGASLEAAYAALAARAPSVGEVWLRFASPPIRHAGTLGGNVANGSPIGDSAPVLMALDAEIELRRGGRVRRLPLDTFYTGYMQNRLEPGEFVQALVVPLASFDRPLRVYKISKRYDCDISALCGAFSIELDDAGLVRAVRLAFGGMAAVVRRAERAEAALIGRPWDATAVAAAREALAQDFQPMTDLRAGAAYRMQVAQNLIQRFWLATRRTDPLPDGATSVWSVMPHDAPRPPAGPVEPVGSGPGTERSTAA